LKEGFLEINRGVIITKAENAEVSLNIIGLMEKSDASGLIFSETKANLINFEANKVVKLLRKTNSNPAYITLD
jgi:hypothetical protein